MAIYEPSAHSAGGSRVTDLEHEMYCVTVTYGNCMPHQKFASSIVNREDAEKLKELAISKGYRDAEVKPETDFHSFLQKKRRGQADKAGSDRKAW